MNINLVEMLMDTIGIEQTKIENCKGDKSIPLPDEICEKFKINKQYYNMYDFNNSELSAWSFYQSILYFLKKDYFREPLSYLTKEYEKFILTCKNEIEKMFYVATDNKTQLNFFEINDTLLNVLSKYLELKIYIMTSSTINVFPNNNTKNKKILIFKEDNCYYPVVDLRFQGYDFLNSYDFNDEKYMYCGLCNKIIRVLNDENHLATHTKENKEQKEQKEKKEQKERNSSDNVLSSTHLLKKNKEELIVTALHLGIEVKKQGKTKIVHKNKNELIEEIINHAKKK